MPVPADDAGRRHNVHLQLARVAIPGLRTRGFTLTELAVVLAIVGLLIGGAMMTLSAQVEQRNYDETRKRLDAAVEALIGFAIANRRLPCPATAGTTGDEAPAGGGSCTTYYGGFLPARTIGLQTVDPQGYALDAWGNRIGYAVSGVAPTGCTGTNTPPHFTSMANLKANGVSCRPNDIDVCLSVTGTAPPSCNSSANRAVSSSTAAVVVYSIGKNGAVASAYGPDEAANVNGDAMFISRTPSDATSAAGTYDDVVVWIPVGVLYGRLISAGVLP